jgi:hypothetical protein
MASKLSLKQILYRKTIFIASFLLGFFLLIGVAGCKEGSTPATPGPTLDAPNTTQDLVQSAPALTPEDVSINWQTGPHSKTFVAGDEGKNSDCARCHAPVEFIPSMDDIPDSCFTCKFTIEPPPPIIPQEEWSHVDCQVCHEVKKGVIQKGIAWLEIAQIGEYSKVNSSTELCQKCHIGVNVPGHKGIEVDGVHAEMTCTQCHDPHTTTAGCGAAGCHPDVFSSITAGHIAEHTSISCAVCHDGAGLEMGVDDAGQMVTLLTIESGGEVMVQPFTSHNISQSVDCERCHFQGNPWNLAETVNSTESP